MDKLTTTALFSGLIIGVAVAVAVITIVPSSEDRSIAQYYAAEATTLVSPHHLRKEMDLGHDDYILADVRTKDEYEEEHIVGALNIDASQSKEKIIADFDELMKEDKDIIIYCYSSACLTGRKIGKMLSENRIFVHELSIGWNEWKYDFNSWNYPNEWDQLDPSRYVVEGSEPGVLEPIEGILAPPCRIDGEFGC